MNGTVYAILHNSSGMVYIGQTTQTPAKLRWKGHKAAARRILPREGHITRAIRKYGSDAFEFIPLIECSSQEILDQCERILIAAWNTLAPHGYNLQAGGYGRGKHSEDAIARMRRSKLGIKSSDEARRKMSESRRGKSRGPHKESTKAKIAEAAKGRKVSEEVRRRISKTMTGKKQSKSAASRTGKKQSEAHKAAIAAGKKAAAQRRLESLDK